MPEVVITCDWTMMSNHHGKEFLGFGTTTPAYILPERAYQKMFFPTMTVDEHGYPQQAPYGMRKIEASLMDAGIDARIVHPSYLDRYMPEGGAKVLMFSGHDYFGLNPPSSTFAGLMKKETLNCVNFKRMLTQPHVLEARRRGMKLIAGGPCAWQISPATRAKIPWIGEFVDSIGGIDTVIEGEADIYVREVVQKALRDEFLPPHVMLGAKEAPKVDQIATIRYPSVNGLVEIGRGCCRGCSFCSVTTRPTRWYPLEKIEAELKVNATVGVKKGLLHSDDVYFYGSPNVMPREEKLIPLLQLAKRYYPQVGWSHVAIASLMTRPKLLSRCAEVLLDDQQSWWGFEVGIETGSPRIITAAMPGKVAPFKASQWPELVVQAAGLMNDNHVFPACTFIVGLPQETEEDVRKTIDLIDDLWDFRAILVPMFFVPLGHLKTKDWFRKDRMSPIQGELLKRALAHGLRQSRRMLDDFFDWEMSHPEAYRFAFRGFINFLDVIAKINGLGSRPTHTPLRLRDPNLTPERLPVPTIPMRE
ncbi:MAG: B12-binding domain-containing radical SAM protein [Thermoplasmata archaeon]|nr:B12-binding domain-containing radical SAM protein [Thermoplasmata archaeon]